jgi:hypothetical protein
LKPVRHLFTDEEIIELHQSNSLENMARICSLRAGRKLSRETMRLWLVALEKKGFSLARDGYFKEPIPVSKAQLKALYLTQKKSISQIVEILADSGIHASHTYVRAWLCEYGIPIRSIREATTIAMKRFIKPLTLSDAEILEKYNSGMSHEKLAELLSTPSRKVYPMVARDAVLRAQKKLGGEIRDPLVNTWSTEVFAQYRQSRDRRAAIGGAVCKKCGAEDSVPCGGFARNARKDGTFQERCGFKCRACGSLWYRSATGEWVAKMRETGSIPSEGAA